MDTTLTPDFRFRRYFVLFRRARISAWWIRFTIPGLEHCSIVEAVYYPDGGYSKATYCIHTDTCFGLTNQDLYWEAPEAMIAKRLADGGITAVAAISVEKRYRHRYIPFGLFTCVTIVKSILGIHGWWIQTPGSLMRRLIKSGAVITWAM